MPTYNSQILLHHIYFLIYLLFQIAIFPTKKPGKKKPALLVQASLVPALALQGRPAPVHPAHPAAGRCQGAGRGSLAVLESWIFRVFFCQIQAAWWLSHPSEKSESQLDHDIPNCFWKVIKMFQTTNQQETYSPKRIRISWGFEFEVAMH
jgi:hypothetical protein